MRPRTTAETLPRRRTRRARPGSGVRTGWPTVTVAWRRRGCLVTGSGSRGESTSPAVPTGFWVGQPQGGDELVGGGDEGGVVVPAGPGASLEVVQAQTGFQFPVVVFDAPADLGQAHEFLQGCVGVEGWRSSSRWILLRRWAIGRAARLRGGCRRRVGG